MMLDPKETRRQRELFNLLLETAANAGIEIIEDRINRRGGVCRLDERMVVVYDSHAPWAQRNKLIIEAIRRLKLDDVYLPPKVRQILEETTGP